MHGKGNFAPNFGQVPSTSMQRLHQQPLPPPPPPPHLQFQQGVSGSRPPLIQQGHGTFGHQPGGHVYGQGSPSVPMAYGGVLNRPPPLLPVHPPLQQSSGVPGFQHMVPPPPPPPLGSSTTLGGGVQSASVSPHSSSMVTLAAPLGPPLPSSAPPMPPSPPLYSFPVPPSGSKSSDDLSRDLRISNASNSEMSVSDSIQKVQNRNAVSQSILFNGNGGKDGTTLKIDYLGDKGSLEKEGKILKSQPSSSRQTEENQGQNDIQSAPVQNESTYQTYHSVIASVTHSPADSDMEMEDDITQPDGNLRFTNSSSGLYHTSDAVCSERDMKDHSQAQLNSSECIIQDDAQSDDLEAPVAQGMKKSSADLVTDGSPFRLIQDYVSDDNSENEEQNALKNVPEDVSRSVTMGNFNCNRDAEKLLSESSQSMKAQETSADPKEDGKKIATASGATKAKYEEVPDKYKNPLYSTDVSFDSFQQKDGKVVGTEFAIPSNDKLQKDNERSAPASPKVDEFGRLVREGTSDSEPDERSYTRRHGRRVRSRSQSRSGSPVDRRRRRSPRKRRERQSRSHSRSPWYRRSRSRSPIFRRTDDFRRDKGTKECFDFLKGRCYRGTSCRFMHHDPDKGERSRHHRGKQKHMEVPSRSKSSTHHENISNISKKASYQEHVATKSLEKMHSRDAKDDNYPLQDIQHANVSKQGDPWIESEIVKSESPRSIAAKVNDSKLVKAEPQAASTLIDTGNCKDYVRKVDHGDKTLQHMDISSVPCTSSDHKSALIKVSNEPAPSLMPYTLPADLVTPPLPKDSNLMPQPSSFPPCPTLMGTYPYTLPGQHSYVALPSVSSWTSLPPPPPPPYGPPMNAGVVTSTACSQIQSSNLPSRDNIGLQACRRPYVTDMPVYYPNSGYEQRPSIPTKEPNQSMQFLPHQSNPNGEQINTSAVAHPYPQQQTRPYISQYSAVESVLSIPGSNNPSLSGYRPDLPTRSQPSYPLPDLGRFKISAHYNPYASTFEQPLNSRFGNNITQQESLSRGKPEGGDVGSSGSRQATSSPNAVKLPRSGGDQYDPLFDCIEPSANSVKKFDHAQNLEGANESVKLSGSNEPLDVEENNKKEVGAVAPTASEDNEEFGETADVEVGLVENVSLNSPLDAADMAAGEVEIDQVKSSAKSRKSKDSRSMKLFKVALANFVKDVLKPSWRQGNMSKEAFKTIVKKTVDKVSGAMKSHHLPKSQAKIDQYINSSQRKLTKLVMGYVDKYVKV